MNFRSFLRIIEHHGFQKIPAKNSGSHQKYFRIFKGKRWVVTVASTKLSGDIKPKTLASMIRQSGLPKKYFNKHRK